MVDYSKELEAAFNAVQCLEAVFEDVYSSPPNRERLLDLTSAILVLWRRLRPFVLTMFKSYYDGKDGKLNTLDDLETKTTPEVTKGRYDKDVTTELHRAVLTYEAACEKARTLIEVYFKIKAVLGGGDGA